MKRRSLLLSTPLFMIGTSRGRSGGRVDSSAFDREIEKFMKVRQVPGASLAVSQHGKLVLAKGYGWADRDQEIPVGTETRFRLASISKPITAAAVMKLIADGKLGWGQSILPFVKKINGGSLPDEMDPRWRNITIAHLLQHSGGWNRDTTFDPMFRPIPIAQDQGEKGPAGAETVIRYMLKKPLQFDPGQDYCYSNFGYCVLGRVIEQLTGMTYESYLKSEILKPMGIVDMRIGRSLDSFAERESRYYMPHAEQATSVFPESPGKVPWPYGGFHLEAMDAHGGWIASASDLIRFVAGIENSEELGLFSKEDEQRLYQPPAPPVARKDGKLMAAYYGGGWMVRPGGPNNPKPNLWHGGSLPGTSTLLVRRRDGLSWAVLFNQRSRDRDLPDGAIDPAMHRAANATFS